MSQESLQFTSCSSFSDAPMMTEREAKEITLKYNTAIEGIQQANVIIEAKVKEAQDIVNDLQSKLDSLVDKEGYENERQQILNSQEDEFERRVLKLVENKYMKRNKLKIKDILNIMAPHPKIECIEDEYEEIQQVPIVSIRDQNEETTLVNQVESTIMVISQLAELYGTKTVYKLCTQCHQNYIGQVNGPSSCLFHPGKIKFYSCRGCGADEYFTCCLKCSKCCTGCRLSHHTPKP